jgi:hypothetical protein
MGLMIRSLVVISIVLAVLAAVAYLTVRFVFVRLAERIAGRIAAQLEKDATTENVARIRDGITRRVTTSRRATQAIERGAAAGRTLRNFSAARGLSVEEAKVAFFGQLDQKARLMDRAIPLPFVGGVGLDALLGLIPFVGDAISALVSGTIILNSLQYGLPKSIVSKMVGNMFVDVMFGAIPLVGDVFDLVFKANTRNVALLHDHIEAERQRLARELVVAMPAVPMHPV